MRFAVGQAFESAVSGRQAVVTESRDDGHAGHLRFLDNGQKQWVRRHLRRPFTLQTLVAPMPFSVEGYYADRPLMATKETARRAFAKAVEWHVVERGYRRDYQRR